jgi:hypothetical protein
MKQKRTVVDLFDDLDGSEGASTVSFALNGKSFEIELSERNQAKLQKALSPFISKAREVQPKRRTRRREPSSADVRAWAHENGVEVSATGRVPREVVDRYLASN